MYLLIYVVTFLLYYVNTCLVLDRYIRSYHDEFPNNVSYNNH